MNAEQQEEFEEMAEKNAYIEKAYETLKNISADEQKRLEYEAREKALRDHNYLLRSNWEAGQKNGTERMRKLTKILLGKKQYKELEEATENQEYCEQLMEEYKL